MITADVINLFRYTVIARCCATKQSDAKHRPEQSRGIPRYTRDDPRSRMGLLRCARNDHLKKSEINQNIFLTVALNYLYCFFVTNPYARFRADWRVIIHGAPQSLIYQKSSVAIKTHF